MALRGHVSCKVACHLYQPLKPTLKPETRQESINDLSSAEDDNIDKSSTDDSSVGDNLYQLTGNGDNISDDEMLMTDVEDVFDINFDDDSGKN